MDVYVCVCVCWRLYAHRFGWRVFHFVVSVTRVFGCGRVDMCGEDGGGCGSRKGCLRFWGWEVRFWRELEMFVMVCLSFQVAS